MPPPAPDRDVPTNASTEFQRQAEKPLITHPIVGPRVVSFQWKDAASMAVKVADFPMDRMPPFARTRFETNMSERIGQIASKNAVTGQVTVEIVDNASGNVMDTVHVDPAKAAGTAP